MLNVPAEVQAVIRSDSAFKNFRVHFPNGERADLTNEDIVYESVNFTESVCSSDTFRFGLAEASVISFETVGVENIVGKTIVCSMEYHLPQDLRATYGEWYSIPYGTFIVDSCPRNHNDIAHRRVTAYSQLKTQFSSPTFLQKRVIPVPQVSVPLNSLLAYYTGDTSMFTETILGTSATGLGRGGVGTLFTSDGRQVSLYASGNQTSNAIKQALFYVGRTDRARGYILEYEETGTITNEELGLEVVRQFNELFPNLDVRYDKAGRQLFETNEDAFRFAYPMLFHPSESKSILPDNSNFRYNYRGVPVELNKFTPTFYDSNLEANDYGCTVGYVTGGVDMRFGVMIDSSGLTGSIVVSGYSADATFKLYSENGNEFGNVIFRSTLAASNAFLAMGMPSDAYKYFYGTMYAYSNAFSNRDFMSGIAELYGAFVHSERDGSTSLEPLDNSNPYQLQLSDVEGNAWWDEYNVNPIGTIKYTFTNPATGQIASGTYVFNEEAKSIYDISGNAFLEAFDFSVYKAQTASKMTNTSLFYLYTGAETGYTKNDFYYYNGTEWVSAGHYDNAESVVKFVLDRMLIPHINAVNFTPVEMDIRALPFLEAGDAFTLELSDGTTLNSYILNHSISGVQRLTDSISSVSGEVIE